MSPIIKSEENLLRETEDHPEQADEERQGDPQKGSYKEEL